MRMICSGLSCLNVGGEVLAHDTGKKAVRVDKLDVHTQTLVVADCGVDLHSIAQHAVLCSCCAVSTKCVGVLRGSQHSQEAAGLTTSV